MSEVTELVQRWISTRFGDEVPDAADRLAAYRKLVPGVLPDDYVEGLLSVRTGASLLSNQVLSVEPPRPPIPGIFGHVGPNPPMDVMFGLQRSHSNVFEELEMLRSVIPSFLVPIGRCHFANVICLDVSPESNGRVYHWWAQGYRLFDDHGEAGWNNMFLLAYSFTDLLRRMRPAPELVDDGTPVGRICFSQP